MTDRPEPLNLDHTQTILEEMRLLLVESKKFGVTLVEDDNGAWGPLGACYLTLRFTNSNDDHVEVMMRVDRVVSRDVEKQARYDRDYPQ